MTVSVSARTLVHGTCDRMAVCSTSENSDAFRSSVSTAKNAFLWASLQRKVFATQTARCSYACSNAAQSCGRATMSLRSTRRYTRSMRDSPHVSVPFSNASSRGSHTSVCTPSAVNASRRISNSVHVGTSRQSTIAMVGGSVVPPQSR